MKNGYEEFECPEGFYLENLQIGDDIECMGKFMGKGYNGVFQGFTYNRYDELSCCVEIHTQKNWNYDSKTWTNEKVNLSEILSVNGWVFYSKIRNIDGMKTIMEAFGEIKE